MKELCILMIFEYLGKRPGGVQIHVLTLCKALKERGHDVLLFPSRPLHLRRDIFVQPFVRFQEMVRIIKIVKKKEINLVHAHGARLPLIMGHLIRRITGTPLVVTIHEAWSRATNLNRQYKVADRIIAVSQEVKTVLKYYGVDKNKLVYIPNMLDPKLFKSVTVDESVSSRCSSYRLVFMGRLDSSKIGILKILLGAIPKTVQEVPNAEVWIVGPRGSNFREISRMIRHINEGIGKKVVRLLGYVRNPTRILEAADVVIGVGRVAMEAMAHGKATIVGSSSADSSFTGALVTRESAGELEKYNFTGRNYKERINTQQMAELIVRLLKDAEYRKKVGEFSKDFSAKKFGVNRVVPKIESVYMSCFKQQRY